MNPILRLLTWWSGSTLNTALWSRRNGEKVGEDAQGNRYMQTSDGKRRWVMYNGDMEATRVSPEWHGWLHYTFDQPPTEAPLPRKDWEKPHLENMTGTSLAYRPPGSILTPASRPARRGDYEAWQPE